VSGQFISLLGFQSIPCLFNQMNTDSLIHSHFTGRSKRGGYVYPSMSGFYHRSRPSE